MENKDYYHLMEERMYADEYFGWYPIKDIKKEITEEDFKIITPTPDQIKKHIETNRIKRMSVQDINKELEECRIKQFKKK